MIELYKPAFKKGAAMAAVGIIIFLVLYAIDPLIYAKPAGWIIMLVVNLLALPIVFMVLGAKATKPNFKSFTFGKAFNAAFFTAITATVITLAFNAIFMNVIDPTWEAEIAEEALNSSEAFMEKMGTPQETIDEAMEKARADGAAKPKGFMGQLKSAGMGLFWYVLIALIIGAVMKTKQSDFVNE